MFNTTAQTFSVDSSFYKAGVFITSLTLFFVKKDPVLPVAVHLAPVVNGYPTDKIAHPYSYVTKASADITCSEATLIPTVFTFECPIHLPPGEHCFIVSTQSGAYEIHTAQNGGYDRVTGKRIWSQPYIGSYFKAQDGSFDADQWTDVSFVLNKAVFPINTPKDVKLLNTTEPTRFEYGRLNVPAFDHQFGGLDSSDALTTSTQYYATVKTLSGGALAEQAIQPQSDTFFSTVKTVEAASTNELKLRLNLVTQDRNVSPLIDLEHAITLLGDWQINNDSTNETTSSGNAIAKYVTKPATLNDQFDATHIQVTCGVQRVAGTDIKVYYKVLSGYDSTPLQNRPWVEITRTAKPHDVSDSEVDFIEDQFFVENVSYVYGGTTLVGFKTYMIKVVMLSSNKCFAPTLANLRIIVGS